MSLGLFSGGKWSLNWTMFGANLKLPFGTRSHISEIWPLHERRMGKKDPNTPKRPLSAYFTSAGGLLLSWNRWYLIPVIGISSTNGRPSLRDFFLSFTWPFCDDYHLTITNWKLEYFSVSPTEKSVFPKPPAVYLSEAYTFEESQIEFTAPNQKLEVTSKMLQGDPTRL